MCQGGLIFWSIEEETAGESVTLFTETCERKSLEEVLHHDLRRETLREKQGPVPFWERPEPWIFLLCFWVITLPSLALCYDQSHNYILHRPILINSMIN